MGNIGKTLANLDAALDCYDVLAALPKGALGAALMEKLREKAKTLGVSLHNLQLTEEEAVEAEEEAIRRAKAR